MKTIHATLLASIGAVVAACSGTATSPSPSGGGSSGTGSSIGSASTGVGGTSNGTIPANGGTPVSLGGSGGGTSERGGNGGTTIGGTSASGGATLGGNSNRGGSPNLGGAPAGGAAAGTRAAGGSASGGKATGGVALGGSATGGRSTGGTSTAGNSGTIATGGKAAAGSTNGGTTAVGGAAALPKFILGADISSVDEAIDRGTRFADTDGTVKSIFDILKNHGFNFIRLRSFVEPGARYGYAYGTGGTCIKNETYCDTPHTVTFAQQVNAAKMGLLLDLHYSDNWTDPGNQIIPEAWRGVTSITELADRVRSYTQEIVSALVSAGARPDIVQIGNETTPGMLMHVPNSNTDCWGNNVSAAAIGGSAANWTNLGTLLKAGIAGVKAVDGSIKTMIHIENTESASGVVSWVRSARNQGVAMDIVGLSCYVAFQGEPAVWQNTFNTLSSTFTDLSFIVAEYNPQRTQANQIMRNLPNGRGLGTFFWEPTQSGEWGSSMFTWSGNTARANTADFQEFDAIATSVGLK